MLLNTITAGLQAGVLFASLCFANPISNFPLARRVSNTTDCGTHGPTNRACWKGEFNVSIDYEAKIPTGQVRKVSGIQFQPRRSWC